MQRLRFNRQEIAGGLGDMGVLVPLAIALITLNQLNATSVFLVTGLLYIITGWTFRLPIPVQPLKAVAVIALTMGAGPEVIKAAGFLMGVILLFLAMTRLCDFLNRIFTKPIVRGIQLGVGLLLVKKGLTLVSDHRLLSGGEEILLSSLGFQIPLGVIVAVVGAAIVMGLASNRRIPASLAVLAFGIVLGTLFGSLANLQSISVGPSAPIFGLPSISDFATAFFFLVLPQIPLTFGNAIVAMSDVAKRYFGEKGDAVTPRALSTSLGVTNIAGSIFGGMPVCHGSGGMTAHFRFGARTGGATIFFGILLVLLGLVFGGSAIHLLTMIPISILGVLLIYVGIEHAMLISDLVGEKKDLFITLIIGVLSMVTGNIFYAFVTGMVIRFSLRYLAGFSYTESLKPEDVK
jgi:sulfate permease, SulP family